MTKDLRTRRRLARNSTSSATGERGKIGARRNRSGLYEGWAADVSERDAELLRALLKR